jgi:hypothetical protein
MLLVMVLIECLEDRRTYSTTFYDVDAKFVSVSKVVAAAHSRILLESTPAALANLLEEVLDKVIEFDLA